MSEEEGIQVPAPLRPTTSGPDAWKVYWKAQGQPWRTEPEIDVKRQEELARCRAIVPDIEKGIYPFKDMKLSRADVEWLLSTHESGDICGPVDWSDKHQRERQGLDLRGADLRQVDLSHLPLAGLSGGEYSRYEMLFTTSKLHLRAGVRMEEANLFEAHLEGCNLINAHLERANLDQAHLEDADLRLIHLEEAKLRGAHLEGTNFYRAHLEAVKMGNSFLSVSTKLRDVILGNELLGFVFLANTHWDNADLAVVNWSQMPMLGNEYKARNPRDKVGKKKDARTRIDDYANAVRVNRQLAVALQAQGLNEAAAHFAYRAQVLQKSVLWYQVTQQGVPLKQRMQVSGGWLFSWVLFLLAGYGYRPRRSILWYLATIVVFAFGYHVFGHLSLWPPDAFVYSLTSFHGRGFFPGLEGKHSLHDPLIMFAAIEAVVGLVIEISFIATFTQRFFGK